MHLQSTVLWLVRSCLCTRQVTADWGQGSQVAVNLG